jgi:hypothetical protein
MNDDSDSVADSDSFAEHRRSIEAALKRSAEARAAASVEMQKTRGPMKVAMADGTVIERR